LAAALAALPTDARRAFAERLLDILASDERGATPPRLRVGRLEVVDDRGRVRVVVGGVGGDDYSPGVAIHDPQGGERATLALFEPGPCLAFSLRGNDALLLGVDDPDPLAMAPGPYVSLLHEGVDVAIGWRVDEETGAVTHQAAAASSGDDDETG
jgi:hypothetical protein